MRYLHLPISLSVFCDTACIASQPFLNNKAVGDWKVEPTAANTHWEIGGKEVDWLSFLEFGYCWTF